MTKNNTIKAFKAFNPDFTCRGFQYEVGKEYTHDGEVVLCESGFHACTDPNDVPRYYDITDCRFGIVEMGENIVFDRKEHGDSKVASDVIYVCDEISFSDFIDACVDYGIEHYSEMEIANGNYSTQAANGDYSKQAANGDYSKQVSNGRGCHHKIFGNNGIISAIGRGSTFTGSVGTLVCLMDYDKNEKPTGWVTGRIGENGLKPNTKYRAFRGKFVEV